MSAGQLLKVQEKRAWERRDSGARIQRSQRSVVCAKSVPDDIMEGAPEQEQQVAVAADIAGEEGGVMRIGKRCYVSNLAWKTSWQVCSRCARALGLRAMAHALGNASRQLSRPGERACSPGPLLALRCVRHSPLARARAGSQGQVPRVRQRRLRQRDARRRR